MIDKVVFEGNKAVLTFKGVPDYSPAAVGSLDFYGGELRGLYRRQAAPVWSGVEGIALCT